MNKLIIRIFSLIVVTSLVLNINVVCYANLDLKIENAANQLQLLGLLVGKENGDLALEDNITRAEMATLVLRVTAQEDIVLSDLSGAMHTDIVGHWAEENIRKAIKLGYMVGYSDYEFGPNNNITYAEVVTLMIRLIGEEKELEGTWPNAQVNKAKKINLLDEDTLFSEDRYNEKVTRGMVAVLLYDTMILNTNVY